MRIDVGVLESIEASFFGPMDVWRDHETLNAFSISHKLNVIKMISPTGLEMCVGEGGHSIVSVEGGTFIQFGVSLSSVGMITGVSLWERPLLM